ncbi:MAG: hypothetical protein AB7F53_07105 [Nitrososphaeraceae archaeon]
MKKLKHRIHRLRKYETKNGCKQMSFWTIIKEEKIGQLSDKPTDKFSYGRA